MEKHAFLTYKPGNQRASFQALYFHFESNKMKPVVEVQLDKRAAATLEEVGVPNLPGSPTFIFLYPSMAPEGRLVLYEFYLE